jgi:hypothetical protein
MTNTDYSELRINSEFKTYQFVAPPPPNVKLSLGTSTSYFQYHAEDVPNRFQRWMLLKVFGIKLEKI